MTGSSTIKSCSQTKDCLTISKIKGFHWKENNSQKKKIYMEKKKYLYHQSSLSILSNNISGEKKGCKTQS